MYKKTRQQGHGLSIQMSILFLYSESDTRYRSLLRVLKMLERVHLCRIERKCLAGGGELGAGYGVLLLPLYRTAPSTSLPHSPEHLPAGLNNCYLGYNGCFSI